MSSCKVSRVQAADFSLKILALLMMLSPVTCVRAETTFPYVAYIAAQQTFTRSGPGQQHYPTSQLPQGHAVEVYRHDADGWCAIRPPEGSFCWVPAHELHRVSANKAEVAVETTIARVGSSLSPARNAVQVMLRRGEEVQLLPAGPNDDPRWLRIAPPAGEFRWVAANGLSRTPPVEGSAGVQLAAGWTRQRVTTGVQTVANESADAFSHLLNSTPTAQQPNQSAPPNLTPVPQPAAANPNEVQLVPGSPAALEVAQSGSVAPPALLGDSTPLPNGTNVELRSSTTPRIRFGNSPSVIGPGTERVQELQLRLSQTVVRPKEEWQFQQLQTEAAALLENSASVSEREHLRDLLDRIARFQRIQLGTPSETPTGIAQAGSNDLGSDFTGKTEQVRNLAQSDLGKKDPFDASASNPNEPRYDAVGRLKPVVSQNEDSPRFALVDDKGAVISFVTPTPDLNLRPYVGMRVGVNGSRGFMPEYRKAHVTAGRVTPIEDRIRR
jgi:uncharacterized protein YgiM (DUF1202 family)